MSGPDKRKTLRIQPFVVACRVIEGSRRLSGYVTDIGPGGARVTCPDQPPAPESAVVLEVKLGRGLAHTPLPARVKWVTPAPAGGSGSSFGLTFEGLDAAQQRLLSSAVDEFRRRAAEI